MQTNRRGFLGAAAAAGTLAVAGTARAAEDKRVLRMGVIGVGWYGMVDAKAALKVGGVEIAAVCDVDSEHLKKAADELETRPTTLSLGGYVASQVECSGQLTTPNPADTRTARSDWPRASW